MQLPIFCKRFNDCPKPNIRLINEGEGFHTFQCLSCGRVQVLTDDKTKGKAVYERMLERERAKAEHMKQSYEKPRMTFDFGRTKR